MILIACDSFKEFGSSTKVGSFIQEGIRSNLSLHTDVINISDGGEGFLNSIIDHLKGEIFTINVRDPLLRPTKAHVGICGNIGIIEMAEASGVQKFEIGERHFMNSSSYGTGELIAFTINKGCNRIILGLGGAATGDGGIGAAQALGMQFKLKDTYISNNKPIISTKDLSNIKDVKFDFIPQRYKNIELIVASDVNNIAIGKNGATRTFGPQKGASEIEIELIEKAMVNYLKLLEKKISQKLNIKGIGAAGALALSLFPIFNVKIKNGLSVVLDLIDFGQKIMKSDWVITGEGCLDKLSLLGKPPLQIAKICKQKNKKVIGVFGMIKDDMEEGIDDFELVIDCSKNEHLNIHTDNFLKIEGPNRLRDAGEKISNYILSHEL